MAEDNTVVVDPFFSAKFYDCKESEQLSHDSAEGAIVDFFEEYKEVGDALVAEVDERCPLEVSAYNHIAITDEMLLDCAEDGLEAAAESLSNYEELWDPDGDGLEITKEQLKAVAPKMVEILRELFSGVKVWGCEVVATREYSTEEVVAILREDSPSRFPEESPNG